MRRINQSNLHGPVTFTTTGTVRVPEGLLLGNSVHLPLTGSIKSGRATVTTTITKASTRETELQIHVIEDMSFLIQDQINVSQVEYALKSFEQGQSIIVENGGSWRPVNRLVSVAATVLAKLAVRARTPSLHNVLFARPFKEFVHDITVSAEGKTVSAPAEQTYFSAKTYPPPLPVEQADLEECLKEEGQSWENYVFLSDVAESSAGIGHKIVDLTTALEIAAYESYRRRRRTGSPPEPPPFNPKTYLGNPNVLGKNPSLKSIDLETYKACYRLWGTRHEFVHNGKALVREYDEIKDSDDRSKTRPYTGPDGAEFRRAVIRAIRWMA